MCVMACINSTNTNFVLFTSYGLDKTRPAQKLLVRVKFTGNPYRTRINVNARHWNTCKCVFLGTRIYGYSDSHSCLCELSLALVLVRVTTCLVNLEMSGNLKHVRKMSGMLLTVREMSGQKSCHGKVSQNCSLLDEYLCSYGYLVASS